MLPKWYFVVFVIFHFYFSKTFIMQAKILIHRLLLLAEHCSYPLLLNPLSCIGKLEIWMYCFLVSYPKMKIVYHLLKKFVYLFMHKSNERCSKSTASSNLLNFGYFHFFLILLISTHFCSTGTGICSCFVWEEDQQFVVD